MAEAIKTDNNFELKKVNRAELKNSFANIIWTQRGKVCDVVGTIVEAYLPNCRLGSLVEINIPHTSDMLLAEVVGFKDERVLLLPFSSLSGIAPGSVITPQKTLDKVAVGDFLLGKVVDPFLNCLNFPDFRPPENAELVPLEKAAPNPVSRERISKPLSLGVRAMDALLTLGNGQRVGIMAGSGVGKSVLMGMMARGSSADINVIGLIGERGREVREFLEKDLGEEGLKRSIVVVVTSDQSPLMKIRGAKAVTSIAEYFSSQGKNVLLMMDSLTRVAMAQREIGLAVGEPPTTKGYTPSVFSLLPKLLERSGPQLKGCGAISGLYTVLVDGDDFNDPIADAARSILDGHINLTRRLAAKGQYPAIDISTSISRVMVDVVSEKHHQMAQRMRGLLGVYEENFDLVQIGAYQPGANPQLDEALRLMPSIELFLKQGISDRSNLKDALFKLEALFAIDKEKSRQLLDD
jgi:flagellum-specific ATP synthase